MRRNRRGKGSTHPAVLKLWRQKYLFAPNNRPSLSADYILFHIAGLQESSPEEPRMHQNSWRPWTHLASLQRSQDRYPMGRGLTTSPSELHLQALSSPLPCNADFVPTPLIQVLRLWWWKYNYNASSRHQSRSGGLYPPNSSSSWLSVITHDTGKNEHSADITGITLHVARCSKSQFNPLTPTVAIRVRI